MATFARSEDLQGAEFIGADLRGARFIESDLSKVVMRGVQVEGADIDAPWLSGGDSFLRVNGVDVIPFVEAELNRRFPGRADRGAGDTDGLRASNPPGATFADTIGWTALGRLGRPEDIASAVAMLAGPDGAWITGQNIAVDGGILP